MRPGWKDVSSFSQRDKERIPNTWERAVGDLRLTIVRKHLHWPSDEWIGMCHNINMNSRPMGAADLDTAQARLESAVAAWLRLQLRGLDAL